MWVLGLFDLGDHELKGLGDVLIVAGAGFGPGTLELRPEVLAFFRRHLSLLWTQIALVADDDQRNRFGSLQMDQRLAKVIVTTPARTCIPDDSGSCLG